MRIVVATWWVLAALASAIDAADRPNVLFISVDDLNDFPTFTQRYPAAKTPNMDQLATEGVRCTDGYAAFPVCSPARAALLTAIGGRPVKP